MIAIAGSRPRCSAINSAIGDGNTPRRPIAQHNVLATNQAGRDMVNPDHVGAVDCDRVASPYPEPPLGLGLW